MKVFPLGHSASLMHCTTNTVCLVMSDSQTNLYEPVILIGSLKKTQVTVSNAVSTVSTSNNLTVIHSM